MIEPSARGPGSPARGEAGPERPGAEGAESGKGEPIVRVDDITVAPGCRTEFLELFETRYLPGARNRGLELTSTVCSPPVDEPAFETDLLLTWRLADVDAFWRARRGAITDANVSGFWAEAAPLLLRRTRRFSQGASASSVSTDTGAPLPGSGRTHYLLFVHAPKSSTWAKRAAASFPDGVDSRVGRHLAGSISETEVSWEVGVPDGMRVFIEDIRSSVAQDGVELVDTVVLGRPLGGGIRAGELRNGIKRTLLLRVEPDTPSAAVEKFERALLGMPSHIPAIRNWRLSRVARSDGDHRWTHAWEQEYEELSGLKDDYMNSPYHWGFVDGWFDAEDPKCIVAPDLCHLYYEIESSILSGGTAA